MTLDLASLRNCLSIRCLSLSLSLALSLTCNSTIASRASYYQPSASSSHRAQSSQAGFLSVAKQNESQSPTVTRGSHSTSSTTDRLSIAMPPGRSPPGLSVETETSIPSYSTTKPGKAYRKT